MTRLARDTLLRDTPGCRDPISGRSGGLAEGLLKRCALLQLLNLVWYVLNQLLELRQLNLEVRLELAHVPPSSPALPPDPTGRCERPDD